MGNPTGIESLLEDNTNFDTWCKDLSAQILRDGFISEDSLKENIKNKILLNENYFYECLCTDLESKIKSIKRRAKVNLKSDKRKSYMNDGFILSELNNRLKKYNIEKDNSRQRNAYVRLRRYLKVNGMENVLIEFKESNKKDER